MTKIHYTYPDGQVRRIPPAAFLRYLVADRPGISLREANHIIREAQGLDDSRESRRTAGRVIASAVRYGGIRLDDNRLYLDEGKEEES